MSACQRPCPLCRRSEAEHPGGVYCPVPLVARFEVELHSTAPAAVEAVRATLAMMPDDGVLVEESGRWFVEAPDVGFLRFALHHQGYVKRVVGGS